MKSFLLAGLCLVGLTFTVRAQQQADENYVGIYGLIQQADNLAATGDPGEALAAFRDAQNQLQQFQKIFPGWNPNIVSFRLNQIAGKIAALKSQMTAPAAPAKKIESAASPATPEPNVQLPTELDNLRTQLQVAQTANELLQAKLREALSVQPAATDPRELDRAREKIRALMKQVDLLQAGHGDTNAPETKTVVVTNVATVYVTNNPAPSPIANATPPVADQPSRAQVAALQSEVEVAKLEKAALQQKLQQVLAGNAPAANVADYETRIRDLTAERNSLMEKLDLASRKNSGGKTPEAAAQISSLTDEAGVLRARLAVAEAQAIPYSDAELALFKTAPPVVANPEAEKKSVKELPAGAAELAASAQRHFVHQEFDAAEADYLKILERDQNNGIALANLATIELQENKLDEAEKHITAAVQQSPNDAYNLSTLGYLKFRREKFDEALDALSRAAQIDANNPEIQNYLGVTLSHKGQRKAAETALRRAIQLNPTYAPAHNNLAVIYLGQTPPMAELARWHYQKALDAGQPRNPDLEKMLADKGAPVTPP